MPWKVEPDTEGVVRVDQRTREAASRGLPETKRVVVLIAYRDGMDVTIEYATPRMCVVDMVVGQMDSDEVHEEPCQSPRRTAAVASVSTQKTTELDAPLAEPFMKDAQLPSFCPDVPV